MADVEGDFQGLSLEDAEEEKVVRLKELVSTTLADVWHPIGGIMISDLSDGRFLLHDGDDPKTIPLNTVDFWVLVQEPPHGFTSEVVARQIGNFIGQFIEYDCKVITLDYTGVLRVRVRVDMEKSLKRRKKIVLPNGTIRYVKFAYDKLTLFCFLCGKLGHKESFYLLHVLQDDQELSFGRDNSLKAPFRRAVAPSSRWLREEGAGAPRMEGRNFRGNTPIMENIGVRLVRSSNRQLRANIGRVNEENLNPNVLPVGYGQSQGLIQRKNMDLVITQDKPSNGLSSGGFGDVMGEDNPMVNGEGLKQPRLHLANSERNDNRNGDEYQNEISADLAQRASREQ
ncbi:hypothetical protein Golax_009437 [Gossypium laxum]|uniref:Zinc knuckle CX2CX4HX4C domain-containing protein n=1 Tax=Gossypium laxum TaxID=34288 RepID=A0A7J9ADN0_9ROSI|nr:hypothetical protein [Gossypium laxum]